MNSNGTGILDMGTTIGAVNIRRIEPISDAAIHGGECNVLTHPVKKKRHVQVGSGNKAKKRRK